MVSKQTLPVLSDVLPVVLFVTEILLTFCTTLDATATVKPNVQYCWSGTEDELSGWKNMSCATGEKQLANSFSTKVLPNTDTSGNQSALPEEQPGYHCMAFKHSITNKLTEGGEDSTAETYTVIYTCDMHNLCEGKQMLQGYMARYEEQSGTLYCCDSQNNCNTHGIKESREHDHTCYKTKTDPNTNNIHGYIEMEICPHQDTWCMRKVEKKDQDGTLTITSEEFGCDYTHFCASRNLTNANQGSCTVIKDPDTHIESTLCCCREDNCFVPSWFNEENMSTSRTGSSMANNTWQRTVLISIGVAVGILIAGIAVFAIRRSVINKRKRDSPKHYAGMEYKTVTADGGDADNVQILSATA